MVSKGKCFANCHLTPAEFGLWEVLRSLSFKFKSKLIFDGENIAQYFGGTGKDVVYRLANRLCAKGWLVCTKKSERGKDGRMSATEYRVLSHAEWTGKHGTKDCSPFAESRMDRSRKRERTVREIGVSPFAESRSSTEESSTENKPIVDTSLLSAPFRNGILDLEEAEFSTKLDEQPHAAIAPALRAPRPVAAPISLQANAPDGGSWEGWEDRRQQLLATHTVHARAC